MSTADSVALTMSSMVSRDVYYEFVAPEASDRREVRVTQTLLIWIILLGLVMAWIRPASVFDIVAFAVVGFATTSAPVILGVFWRGGTAAGGIASLILCPGITILFFLEYIPPQYTFGMHYGFIGVIIAYVIFVAVSLATLVLAEDTIGAHSRSFWERAE